VWAIRPSTYPPRENAFKRRPGGGKRRKAVADRGGSGYEVAREVVVCAEVARQYADREPDMLPARPPRKRRIQQIMDELYGDLLRSTFTSSYVQQRA
jgi:hypothetical protein